MPASETIERLNQTLLPEGEHGSRLYAVLDGASDRSVVESVYTLHPPFECLYSGDLAPDLAECAPYLVEVKPGHAFTGWLMESCWGKSRGIYIEAECDIRQMRKHLRSLLLVQDPDGKTLYFRFYDPRVLRVFLPTCTPDEQSRIFGPARWIAMEDESPDRLLKFVPDAVEPQVVVLGQPVAPAGGPGSTDPNRSGESGAPGRGQRP